MKTVLIKLTCRPLHHINEFMKKRIVVDTGKLSGVESLNRLAESC